MQKNDKYFRRYFGLSVGLGLLLLMLVGLESCSSFPSLAISPKKNIGLVRLKPQHYPIFEDDLDYGRLVEGVNQSLQYLAKIPADRQFEFGEDQYQTTDLIRSLNHFLTFIQMKPKLAELNRFIRSDFRVYSDWAAVKKPKVQFTGYYEPCLKGSQTPDAVYRYPIYGRPADLVSIDLGRFATKYQGERIYGRYTDQGVVPYHDRAAIDQKQVLVNKAPILCWLSDPIDRFFLHVQGSGDVVLPDGQTLHLGYHAKNGHPYRSIGKLLIDQGKVSKAEMSMQKIRAYLKSHPQEIDTILNHNPSYVFFRILDEGPIGNLGVALTAGRSIATDQKIYPPAALAYIESQKPLVSDSNQIDAWVEMHRFVLNQDTGGAIRGSYRTDLFWGNGVYAEIAAGHLNHLGRLYFLIVRPAVQSKNIDSLK